MQCFRGLAHHPFHSKSQVSLRLFSFVSITKLSASAPLYRLPIPTIPHPKQTRYFHQSSVNAVVRKLDNDSEFKTATSKEKLIVLDCFATWCAPCRAIAPKIEGFSNEYPDVEFYKIDVDELPKLAGELGVRAMPTFLFFKNGEKIDEVVGASQNAVETAIKRYK